MKKKNNIQKYINILHWFVGLGAILGGTIAVIYPHNPMDIPIPENGYFPFPSFLIPGLILLIVLGFGNLLSIWIQKKTRFIHTYVSGAMGVILMSWIVIQCYMLQSIVFLHTLFFIIGAIQGLLALILILQNQQKNNRI